MLLVTDEYNSTTNTHSPIQKCLSGTPIIEAAIEVSAMLHKTGFQNGSGSVFV